MNFDETLHDLAIALTVASAKLLSRLQDPPAANGSRHSHRHLDKFSDLLHELEEVIDHVEGEVDDQVSKEYVGNAKDAKLSHCNSCYKVIPTARLEAVPGTRYCVSCAEDLQKRPPDSFETVAESDSQRFWRAHEQGLEGDRLRAPARRFRGNAYERWGGVSNESRKKPGNTC